MAAAGFSIGRFDRAGTPFLGAPVDDGVIDLCALAGLPATTTLLDLLLDWDRSFERLQAAWAQGADGAQRLPAKGLAVLAPLQPRQVFCTGANYRRHVVDYVVARGTGPDGARLDEAALRALGEANVDHQLTHGAPYVFTKTASSVCGPFDDLVVPRWTDQLDWELELGVVMGRDALDVSRDDAMTHVAGYLIANDITARDRIFREDARAMGADWLSGKGGPGFLPLGPHFTPAAFVPNPHALAMRLSVSGEVMQDDTTADMTFDIPRQIEFVTGRARMWAGDLLCTGSPTGNGLFSGRFLKAGDTMQATIEGLGSQRTFCVEAAR